MASVAISVSLQNACTPRTGIKKTARITCSLGTKQKIDVITVNVDNKKVSLTGTPERTAVQKNEPAHMEGHSTHAEEMVLATPVFSDERWKNGTWDLNMFVEKGKMDWDSVIVAEARRRKVLEINPESATNETPVTFRSSIIPWWAWLMRSYLPEAELINGRAAMVGFFMAYFVDVLTGLDVVGQTGNVICKAGLLVTVIGIIVFRKTKDIGNIQKLVDEATYYDKQWQATWQNQSTLSVSSNQGKKGK